VEKLLEREFYVVLQHDPRGVFTLTGSGEAVEGRYTQMRLDVSRSPEFSQLAAPKPDPEQQKIQRETLERVLRSAQQTFNNAPEPERLEVFDSQLAADTRQQALFAILASWVAMLLYLWFRFGNWTFGLAAVLCLIHDLSFTLGAIAVCHYLHLVPGMNLLGIQDFKIDLAAVAALLTLVGYSVNDTIVVFDRIREVRGKDPRLTPQMINDSVNQTLGRTVLASLTVFLVAFVLYAFGGEGVHLFSFIMLVGVIVGTYSSIFVASPLLLFFGEGRQERTEVAALETTAVTASEEVVEG
jgi:SecD/SecF fusion protein